MSGNGEQEDRECEDGEGWWLSDSKNSHCNIGSAAGPIKDEKSYPAVDMECENCEENGPPSPNNRLPGMSNHKKQNGSPRPNRQLSKETQVLLPVYSMPVSIQGLHGKGVAFSDLCKLTAVNMPPVSHPQRGRPDNIVRMPHQFPRNSSPYGSRWSVIEKTLGTISERINRSSYFNFLLFFESVILSYNGSYRSKWDFQGIASYFEQLNSYRQDEFIKVLSKMGRMSLDLPRLCQRDIPLLSQGVQQTIHLTRQQIACLLAHAFFCTFPSRNVDPPRSASHSKWKNEGPPLPTINFSSLFKMVSSDSIPAQYSKIDCVMNYFRRVTDYSTWPNLAHEHVTFERRVLDSKIDWRKSESQFTNLRVTSEGTIESDAIGLAHVDFANKLVGGGVLGRGCVQEEIRFLGFTEMIVSRLFTEELRDNECLVVSGCEQYNHYEGYSNTFRWTGDFKDQTEKDTYGRCLAQVIVMDARKYYNNGDQYQMFWVERELNKAYCGFSDGNGTHPAAIATGNWGCGDFRGNRHLKSLIQLMAAAEAKRDVFYFTHREKELVDELFQVHELFRKHRLTVGDAYELIEQYSKSGDFYDDKRQLYHFILDRYTSGPPS